MFNTSSLEKKWGAVLDHKDCAPLKDANKRATIAQLLENTQVALREERAAQHGFLAESGVNTGNVTDQGANLGYDPILISLVRRAMPNILAYDVAGVQPMKMPTGLIFALKSLYKSTKAGQTSGDEALHFGYGDDRQFDGPNTAFSGKYSTTQLESLSGAYGEAGAVAGGFGEMGFEIVKTSVTAQSRALRANYTTELAQDLKAVHGLDAESELANILSTEILAEINKEIIDGVRTAAVEGGISGTFDLVTNSDGRWSVEKYKGLLMQIERDANGIGYDTRRGKGNFAIVSSNVASAIAAAGMLDYTPSLKTDMESDPTTASLLAGTINGQMKVFVNPYIDSEEVLIGYRGKNVYDAGVFYCPYVPLTMMRAIDPNNFQPRIGFKTRYGIRANPFVAEDGANSAFGAAGTNYYFRKFTVDNLIGEFAHS